MYNGVMNVVAATSGICSFAKGITYIVSGGITVLIVRLCSMYEMVLENECGCDLIGLIIELINV